MAIFRGGLRGLTNPKNLYISGEFHRISFHMLCPIPKESN